MVENHCQKSHNQKRYNTCFLLQELVRRGIPHHFRGMAWQLLCSAHESKDKAKYADYMKRQSACEKVIRRDIARTYPEHDFFKKKDGIGQEVKLDFSLFDISLVILFRAYDRLYSTS